MRNLLKLLSGLVYFLSFVLITNVSFAQNDKLRNVEIPDIPGFHTLKCDFHMHTVFSDGLVWPTVRVDEAIREGIDVIAFTDHVEYRPHRDDVKPDLNRPFDIAINKAQKNGVILIKGAEITRSMPPGHFNAIFLEDPNALDVESWEDALKIAIKQGAFVFWNHPGWRQENEIPIWYDEHSKILKNKWISGIEIVNEKSYYPLCYQWALDSNLCIIGNSDIHDPIEPFYNPLIEEHRPLTLVFAEDTTRAGIKEALFEKRTAVYYNDTIFGNSNYLEPLVNASIEVVDSIVNFEENGPAYFRLKNNSGLYFVMNSGGPADDVFAPGGMILYPGEVVILQINKRKFGQRGIKEISIPFVIENFLVEPEQGLSFNLKIKVNFGE